MTRLLTRGDLLRILDPDRCVDALRTGFLDHVPGTAAHKSVVPLPFPGTATVLLPGLLPGIDAYTVKVNAKFPGAAPALRGLVCLHSGRDGELLAVLDSATVTAWRTGLAAALAVDVLATGARPGAYTLGVVGAGAQAGTVLRGLERLRPWRDLVVHDIAPDRAGAFAARHGGRPAANAREVAAAADVVVLATWPDRPLLERADTREDQIVVSLGSDERGKCELAADLLASADVVVDDLALARSAGVLSAPGAPAGARTLRDALTAGPGPAAPARRTVYAPVGLPWQDLALAHLLHRTAQEQDIGTRIDWLN